MLPSIQAPPIRIIVRIPGKPFAKPAPRAVFNPALGHAHVHQDPREGTWRKYAQDYIREALAQGGMKPPAFPDGPIDLMVRAVFACPRGRFLKRDIRPAEWRDKLPDASNVLKALEDAGNGLLWLDDRQVAQVKVEKVTGEQGTPPHMIIEVSRLDPLPHIPRFR